MHNVTCKLKRKKQTIQSKTLKFDIVYNASTLGNLSRSVQKGTNSIHRIEKISKAHIIISMCNSIVSSAFTDQHERVTFLKIAKKSFSGRMWCNSLDAIVLLRCVLTRNKLHCNQPIRVENISKYIIMQWTHWE